MTKTTHSQAITQIISAFVFMFLASTSAWAGVEKFVYAYDAHGSQLSPNNAADRCPDAADGKIKNKCHGVRIGKNGKYALELPSDQITSPDQLVLVAKEYQFHEAKSKPGIEDDTYIEVRKKRRLEKVKLGMHNKGADIDKLSESCVKAVEQHYDVNLDEDDDGEDDDRSHKRNKRSLAEAAPDLDVDIVNAALRNRKQDNDREEEHEEESEDDDNEHALKKALLDTLDQDDEEKLIEIASLALENPDSDSALNAISKNITQGLINPELLEETADRIITQVSEIVSGTPETPLMMLDADRYVARVNEVIILSTDNAINANRFFGYTWMGVESDLPSASFSRAEPGSYLVCVTGEIDSGNESSSDCVRIEIKAISYPVITAYPILLPANEEVALSGFFSVGAESYQWGSAAGSFADAAAMDTRWTAPAVKGSYEISLTINDEESTSIAVEVYDVLPVATASSDKEIIYTDDATPAAVLTSSSISTDGSAIDSIEWSIIEQPSGSDAVLSAASAPVTEFSATTLGRYVIRLIAGKGGINAHTDLEIDVRQRGIPVADAGEAITTFRNTVVRLDGRGSEDPDDLPLSYSWSANAGVLADADSSVASFVSDTLGSVEAMLNVSNGSQEASDSVTINVRNRLPVASDDYFDPSLGEMAEDYLHAFDGDGDSLTYTLLTEPKNGGVAIDEDGQFSYIPAGPKGCKYHPDHKPYDNELGGKNVPVLKLCADKFVVSVGETVTLTVSNSINATKHQGYEWIGVESDSETAEFIATEPGIHNICITGYIGNSKNNSTACVDISVKEAETSDADNPARFEEGFVDSFQFLVNDGFGNSNIATVNLVIGWENTPPVLEDEALNTEEETSVTSTLHSSDVDNQLLIYSVVNQGSLGTLSITDATTGTFSYTPEHNAFGVDVIEVQAFDGHDYSDTAEVTITINGSNDVPTAADGSFTTAEDNSILGAQLSAHEPDGEALSYQLMCNASLGTVVLTDAANGLVNYIPNFNAQGHDQFSFRVSDGKDYSNTAQVSITITPVNDAPVAHDLNRIFTAEDQAFNATLNGEDVDLDGLTYRFINSGTLGTAVITDASTGAFTYTPTPDLNGSENLTISYVVNDGQVDSNIAYVPITISPNDPPVAADLSIDTDNATPIESSLSAADPEDGAIAYEIVAQPGKGTVQILDLGSGAFRYTPDGTVGSDSFTYLARDNKAASNIATVSVSVTEFNNAPVANASSFTAFEATPYTNILTGSDTEGSPLSFAIANNGLLGSASIDDAASGAFSYTPNSGSSGNDHFTFTVDDGDKTSAEALVNATIISLNEACRGPQAPGYDADADGFADFIEAAFYAADTNAGDPNDDSITPNGLNPNDYSVDFSDDDDGDGFADYVELWLGTDPADENSVPTDSLNKAVPACVNGGRDIFPASLLAFDILTPVVTVTGTSDVASFALTAMDNDSGVAEVKLLLTSPSGQELRASFTKDPASMFLYQNFDSDAFSYYAEAGVWQVTELEIIDEASNSILYGTADLEERDFPTEVQVINANSDIAAASLLNFLVDTPSIDVSVQDQAAQFTVEASDSPAGIHRITVTLRSPSGKNFRWAEMVDGGYPSSFNGALTTNTFDAYAETGTWQVSELAIIDAAGNALKLSTSQIATAGFDTDVEITNGVADTTLPLLDDFQILTPKVYPAPGDATANYSVTASDTESGVKSIEVMLTSPSGEQSMEAVMSSASLPATITTGLKTAEFGTQTEPGTWVVEYVAVSDGANNLASYDTAALVAAGYDTEVEVIYLSGDGINTIPVAYGDHITTDEDMAYDGQLQAYDADGHEVTFHAVTPAEHGGVEIDANDGSFVYTPEKDYFGSDSFTFLVDDGFSESNTATISITVNPVNDAPVSEGFDIEVTANTTYHDNIEASDVEDDLLTFAIVDNGSLGTASLVNVNTGAYTYDPNPMALGNDTFTFTVSDGEYTVGPFTVNVAIKPDIWIVSFDVGTPVVSNKDLNVPIYADITFNKAATELERVEMVLMGPSGQSIDYGRSNPTADPISMSEVINTSQVDLEAGTWEFRAVMARRNGGTLQMVEEDLVDAGFSATVTVVENLLPTADDSEIATQVNVPLEGQLVGEDPDGDPLSYIVVSAPSHGEADVNANDGSFIYTPTSHYQGSDSFTFKVSDGFVESTIATVSISITEPNGVPVAYTDSIAVFRNLAYGGQLQGIDPENEALTYHLVDDASLGSVSITENSGEFVYTPTFDLVGSDSFSFYVSDGINDSNVATVNVLILHEDQVCRFSDDAPGRDDDGDGWANVVEVAFATNINDANSTPVGMSETDLGISYSDDDDLDSYFDYVEVWLGADANDASAKPTESTLGLLPPCFDANSDGIKPRLLGFDITTETVDVSGGTGTVNYAMTVIDNASGVRRVRIDLLSPSGAYATTAITFDDYPVARGLSLSSDVFSEFAEHGTWQIEAVTLYDEAGNKRTIDTAELTDAGFPTDVNIQNINSDNSGPTLDDFSVLTPNVNAVSGLEVISFAIDASDDIAGIHAIDITLTTPSGVIIEAIGRYSDSTPLSLSTQIDTATLSHFSEQGAWTISSLLLTDAAGNTSQHADQLAGRGFDTSVAVTNTGSDGVAPSLQGLSILTPEVFPAAGDARMSFMVSALDDVSGIEKIRVDLQGPNGQYLAAWGYFFDTTPLSASGQMDTAVLSTLLQEGDWTITEVEVFDAAGNSSKVDTIALENSGYSTTVTVSY